MDVVVVGSCMIDLISYAPRLPLNGETLHGTKFALGFGGKGANQCVAARKLGCSSLLVARLGNDSFGCDYKNTFKTLGIDSKHVKTTDGVSSGMAQIIVADSGENQIVIVAGANNKLSVDDVQLAREEIKECKVLITQMEVPVEATIEALKIRAQSNSGLSLFNAAPAQKSLPPELYKLPTIFCVNETEAQLLTGKKLSTVDEAHQAASMLQSRGCNHVIITLGGDGAVYKSPNGNSVHIPSVPVKVLDTTGAGDSFIGALAFYISKKPELDLTEGIRRACAVAASSVQKPGTQSSFPDIKQLPTDLL